MKLKWKQEKPSGEGWYFWRRAKTVKDPWKWSAFFVTSNEGSRGRLSVFDCVGNPIPFSYWEGGTETYCPSGGWWAKIEMEV